MRTQHMGVGHLLPVGEGKSMAKSSQKCAGSPHEPRTRRKLRLYLAGFAVEFLGNPMLVLGYLTRIPLRDKIQLDS